MRTKLRHITPLFVAAGAAAAILTAPAAIAQPAPPAPEPAPAPAQEPARASGLPQCVDTGGAEALGGSTTECATPGNVQINSTPAEQEYVGPWGDMFGGEGFFFP
ncbi:hypothetical protein BST36_01105 [Mycolicibacterium moriokaense]|jgi:hypothetical protein|uniref:Intersectin-EH binding protein Ibp1 n=1 Tax=Mycolicibacterium moriokaense TaxID=39691 RepID=A0AAD1H8J5_9MYCO|nr:hypothetical protein [Mycolicibacterium moriokaense]MCV7041081.1 hypothetical protein [Mycolicibacterium moriokaense]ORB27303.1 hypothetical protein BST36_01105 [Mycolicibacterium moriokaense]BBX00642.1 hypothetical protein MMOR_15780 [Mycolicibacterium moriokaense]